MVQPSLRSFRSRSTLAIVAIGGALGCAVPVEPGTGTESDSPRPVFNVVFGIGKNDLGLNKQSEGYAINDSGYVAGFHTVNNATGYDHGFLKRLNDTIIDLPQLPAQGSNASAWALAVNNKNAVVGWSAPNDGSAAYRAVRWTISAGGVTVADLGTLGSGSRAQALGINDLGQIVGWSDIRQTGQRRAFLKSPSGAMSDLGALSGDKESEARDVNNQKVVVGVSFSPTGNPRAFKVTGGVMAALPGGAASEAFSINDNGDVAGWIRQSTTTGPTQAVIWPASGGSILVDPNQSSEAVGINNGGEIVGNRFSGGLWQPFFRFYSSSAGLGSLSLLPVFQTNVSSFARGIHNRILESPSSVYCRIAGSGPVTSTGGTRALVWGVSGC